ncbi:MAG: hypothetical protein ACW98J_00165 [Candidatus Thorarchaeota archaeon]|jgi:hypothetical protein
MTFQRDARTTKERFEIQFLNETRTCSFREDVPELSIAGEKLGPFKSGTETQLPNWVIEKLVAHNLVDLDATEAYESLRRFQNLYNAEEKQPHKLQVFPPLLYSAIIRKVNQLQSDKTSIGPRRHDEIEKIRNMLEILVETRLSKLWRVAKSKSGANQDRRKQMAIEERWLVDELGTLLSTWREMVTD